MDKNDTSLNNPEIFDMVLGIQAKKVSEELDRLYRLIRITYEDMEPEERRDKFGETMLQMDKRVMDLTIEVNRLIAIAKKEMK